MKRQYNLALMPQKKGAAVVEFAQNFSDLADHYLLGENSYPHVTLYQFETDEAALNALGERLKREWQERPLALEFNEWTYVTYDNSTYWLSLMPNQSEILHKMHAHIADLIQQPVKESFTPHMTLMNSKMKEGAKEIQARWHLYATIADYFVLTLGKSDPVGQFTEILRRSQYMGECCCGAIQFYCEGDPFFTQYCHCNKCREIATPSRREVDKQGYAWTAGYRTADFKMTAGMDHLEEVVRNNAKLLRCRSCHGLIYGISLDPKKQGGIGVNVNNFYFAGGMPECFKSVRHVWYVNRKVDFEDGLQKFKDAPREQFGSGVLWEGDEVARGE